MLGLGAALGCGAAQGGDNATINVSAVILPRVACTFAAPGASGPAYGKRAPAPNAICFSNAAPTYRIRRSVEVQTGPGAQAGTVVLSIEP